MNQTKGLNLKSDLREEKKVLAITSFTEFTERYSYYVIQSLLIFYLIGHFKLSQQTASELIGTVLSMVYISAILGGYISEKIIGYYRAGILGSILMASGSLIIAIFSSEHLLFLGLAFIATSSGLIKSNMSSFIGSFYDKSSLSDGHRDFGFNIFYVGINIGSFCALFVASSLKEHFGFQAPFYSCVVVCFIMLFVLIICLKPLNKHIRDVELTFVKVLKTFVIIAIYIIFLFFIFNNQNLADWSIVATSIICLAILALSARNGNFLKVICALVFFILSIIYWGIYFQQFISFLLFTDYAVNTTVLNTSQIISVEAFFVLVLGFFMGKLWLKLAQKGKEVKDIDKFNIGFILLAFCCFCIWFAVYVSAPTLKVSVLGFVIAYFVLAISELSLSAIGLSLITKITPKGYVSLYMGIWLVTLGLGAKLGGYLGGLIYLPKDNLAVMKQNMSSALISFIFIAIATSVVILCIRGVLNKILAKN